MEPSLNTAIEHMYRCDNNSLKHDTDEIVVESPLSMQLMLPTDERVDIGITLRTPGDDEALVVGHLKAEGLIDDFDDIHHISVDETSDKCARICVHLAATVAVAQASSRRISRLTRKSMMYGSCGFCGRSDESAIDCIANVDLQRNSYTVFSRQLRQFPVYLKEHQRIHKKTGGVHAAMLWHRDKNFHAEDVGRHNAVDKVIGKAILAMGKLPTNMPLVVSSRAGFEICQKAIHCGIPLLSAMGAPTSMAVTVATRHGLSLVAFLDENRFNCYSGLHRISIGA